MPFNPQSLHTRITLSIALLTGLFAASTLFSLYTIEQQQQDEAVRQLANRLQLGQQHFTVQAMRYKENAPRDYPSYYRDLRLYFEDLKRSREELTHVIERFAPAPDGSAAPSSLAALQLSPRSRILAMRLSSAWTEFLAQLDERIGPDPAEPRLEWAAEWIVDRHRPLEELTKDLIETLDAEMNARSDTASLVSRVLLMLALLVSIATFVWFRLAVLAPLSSTVSGFERVANGDFLHRVPVGARNEIGSLALSFNRLADRLNALRTLLTGLEQGDDLGSTLTSLSKLLPPLIPIDWLGVLVIDRDGNFHLERSISDGLPGNLSNLRFSAERTVLRECIDHGKPLHIPDIAGLAAMSDEYKFMRRLAETGRRDAIFLPIGGDSGVQGVAVFASRNPNNFRSEHIDLLGNLGILLGVSLGRTIKLAERQRLAAVGQFASGIVHEIRNPLATIGLMIEHIQGLDLPSGSQRRITLASTELARLERLLSEILDYARPMDLQLAETDIGHFMEEIIIAESTPDHPLQLQMEHSPMARLDQDRIRQVMLNLLRNAQQAAAPNSPITVTVRMETADQICISVCNLGAPIPENIKARIFEPFVTSRTGGTGLGLAVVRGIVQAHGGLISTHHDGLVGTCFRILLPAHHA